MALTPVQEAPVPVPMARLARRGRHAAHLLILASLGLLVLASSAFAPTPAAAPVTAAPAAPARETALPGWLQPVRDSALPNQGGNAAASARASLSARGASSTPSAAAAGASESASASAVPRGSAAAAAPALAVPEWLLSTQDLPLWSGPDDAAILFGTLAPRSYLKPLGPVEGGRLLTYVAGDATHAEGPAWVDAQLVEPAPPPTGALALAPPAASGETLAFKPLIAAVPRRVGEAPPPEVTARQVAVVDEASGALLYGQRPNERSANASITKIVTTIVALEREPNLDRRIPVTINGFEMAARDGSQVIGLEPGEQVRLRTLLYGMMLWSGNDAAEQVAVSLAGTRERYVGWMNDKVAQLGLKDTRFVTPSGMDAPGHYSSAYDMALLGRYAMRNEAFREMAAAPSYEADGYPLVNINRLLAAYPGADGIKTGFTDEARKTIVACASRGGRRVYVSLLRSEDLVGDSTALFDWVWQSFQW